HADRLDAVAAGLRARPLYVDPELGWALTADERRGLLRTLRAADVPVLLAVLPHEDEDESGGDGERMIQGLQHRLRRDAVYLVADQEGRLELASMGIPRSLDVPYSLLWTDRRYDDAGHRVRTTAFGGLAERLTAIVQRVDAAPPGTPNGPVSSLDPLRPLDASPPDGPGLDVGGDVIAPLVVGALLGLVAFGVAAGAVAGVRAARRRPGA
ncbi:hypothetical protein ACVU7I_13445, partial [Patulibacter sp. S7RM1-6]